MFMFTLAATVPARIWFLKSLKIASLKFFRLSAQLCIFHGYEILSSTLTNLRVVTQPHVTNFKFKFFFRGLKTGLFSWLLFLTTVSFLYFYKIASFNKVLLGWVVGLMVCYWLLSGFVFFFKKYRFGKFTSANQRFWRRSYILFWLIEGFVFTIFLYLTFNASAECSVMFDNSVFYKTHLYSWRSGLSKIALIVCAIHLTHAFLVTSKWGKYVDTVAYLFLMLVITLYVVWFEFYQMYHAVNFFSQLTWLYDYNNHYWYVDAEKKRSRIANNYFFVLLLLKFWHIIFIFSMLLFIILRSTEIGKISYNSISSLKLNFIFLFLFAWLGVISWLKYFFRPFLNFSFDAFYAECKNFPFVHYVVDTYMVQACILRCFTKNRYIYIATPFDDECVLYEKNYTTLFNVVSAI